MARVRWSRSVVALFLLAGSLAWVVPELVRPSAAGAVTAPTPATNWVVTDYVAPVDGANPGAVAIDAGGDAWSTLPGSNSIGRVDPTTGAFTSYAIPSANSTPTDITAGPDGAMWFTEGDTSRIGRITGGGAVTEFSAGAGSHPTDITSGPDGALWFTDPFVGTVNRIDTAGGLTSYPLPNPTSGAVGITSGPDGALWFAEAASGMVARVTTIGTITEFPLPTPASTPLAITATSDGRLAVAERDAHAVAFVTTGGVVDEKPLAAPQLAPLGIAAGLNGSVWVAATATGTSGAAVALMQSDGTVTNNLLDIGGSSPGSVIFPQSMATTGSAVWFVQPDANRVSALAFDTSAFTTIPLPGDSRAADLVVDPSGNIWYTDYWAGTIGRVDGQTHAVTIYPIPTSGSAPIGIAVDPDGIVWFAEYDTNRIGRLDPSSPGGAITEYPIPTAESKPTEMIVGPDHAIWFSEEDGGNLARLDRTTFAITETSLGPPGTLPRGLTIGPDDNIWVVTKKPGSGLGDAPSGLSMVTPAGDVTFFEYPMNGTDPESVTSIASLLWWGAMDGAVAGSMTTTGAVTQRNLDHGTRGITEGADGNAWYGGFVSSRLGVIMPSGQVTERLLGASSTSGASGCTQDDGPLPIACGVVYDVARGLGGDLWMSSSNNSIVRYEIQVGLVLTDEAGPATVTPGQSVDVSFTAANRGPAPAVGVATQAGSDGIPVKLTGPSGWSCNAAATCATPQLSAATSARFHAALTIPAGAVPGTVISVQLAAAANDDDTPSHATVQMVVTAAPTTTSTTPLSSGTLPVTGDASGALALLGAALVVTGVVLLGVRRRQES